ncbi:MAG TPA: DUF4136 domain-containing protein, partial [Chitinophagaceae bacterium]
MKTVKWTFISSIVVAALVFAGCTSSVHFQKDDSADFSKYKTFTWVEKNDSAKENKRNDLMEQKFKEAVTKELAKQGWRIDNKRPDVLVSYDVL